MLSVNLQSFGDSTASKFLLSVAVALAAVGASALSPGVRLLKDALYRDILAGFHNAEIAIASTSTDINIRPPVAVRLTSAH